MSFNEVTKNPSRFIRKEKNNVSRGSFPSTAQKRGDIAKDIRGTASGKVSRKEMEDKYGKREENSFSEVSKNDSNWSEV